MITIEESILIIVVGFLVGCIPLAGCYLMQWFAERDVNREQKQRRC